MGCSSSKEATAAVATKEGTKKTSSSNLATEEINNENDTRKYHEQREKKNTDGTDKMSAISNEEVLDTTTTSTSVNITNKTRAPEITTTAMTEEEARMPMSSIETTKAILGKDHDLILRYACLSKHGRDPEVLLKPNQDSYCVTTNFCNQKDDIFFGVFDGHGPTGESCSQFASKRLPELVQSQYAHYKKIAGSLAEEDVIIQTSLKNAHVKCNDELHKNENINDSFSGTTSITTCIHGNGHSMTVCNLGDSRAIIGSDIGKPNNELVAVPLSKDQTPKRADEAQRCKDAGARILSQGQLEPKTNGESEEEEYEDPLRVWAQNGKFPGTAFTRSIGDAVADKIGVFAEPEILKLNISEKEKIIVLASDGIFDVMTNQEVINMCYKNFHDPMKACTNIIEHSHDEWLLNEDCTDENNASYDDMTVMCIFIGDAPPPAAEEEHDKNANETATTKNSKPRKRIRQKTLKNLDDMENQ